MQGRCPERMPALLLIGGRTRRRFLGWPGCSLSTVIFLLTGNGWFSNYTAMISTSFVTFANFCFWYGFDFRPSAQGRGAI